MLGSSSGFREAAGLALARAGLDVFGVHLDRTATLANVDRIVGAIEGLGRRVHFFNVNAADADRRTEVVEEMARTMEVPASAGRRKVLLTRWRSARSSPSSPTDPMKEAVSAAQMDMTLDVMAHTLVYWTQGS